MPHKPPRAGAGANVDLGRIEALRAREDAAFVAARPRSAALRERAKRSMPLGVPLLWMDMLHDHPPIFIDSAEGATFTDVDGNHYLDFYSAITIASAGHTNAALLEPVIERLRNGIQFMAPTEDAVVASEILSQRWGLPKWQFALSSSQAIQDCIRLARIATGRDRLLAFEGKYHGHLAELLAIPGADGRSVPEYVGISEKEVEGTVVVGWNDLEAVERELASRDVAVIVAEPALTNSGIVFPASGFHEELRRLATETETLLLIDETQTLPCAFGGLVRAWGLEPDFVILGKSFAGGLHTSAYGMTAEIAALLEVEAPPYEVSGEAVDEPAIGGTMYGSALSTAAARAALEFVWTEENHARTQALAERLATGLREAIDEHGLAWDVYYLGNRAGFRFAPDPPSNNLEAGERDLPPFRNLQRVYMANRGIMDFGWWCAPVISVQTEAAHVDRYIEVFRELLAETMTP